MGDRGEDGVETSNEIGVGHAPYSDLEAEMRPTQPAPDRHSHPAIGSNSSHWMKQSTNLLGVLEVLEQSVVVLLNQLLH